MDPLIAFLQSAFALRARQGWISLLIGLTMWGLIYADILPASDVPSGWKAFFAFLTVLGVVILIVAAGTVIYERMRKRMLIERAVEQKKAERIHRDAEAAKNVETLKGWEAAVLLDLLRGEKRFNESYDQVYGLAQKGIIYQVSLGDVYEIADVIWRDKDRLLRSLPSKTDGYTGLS